MKTKLIILFSFLSAFVIGQNPHNYNDSVTFDGSYFNLQNSNARYKIGGVNLNHYHIGQHIDNVLDYDTSDRAFKYYPTRLSVGTNPYFYNEPSNNIPNVNHSNVITLNSALTVGSSASGYNKYGLLAYSNSGIAGYFNSTSNNAINTSSTSGRGAFISSLNSIGAEISSVTGTCLLVISSASLAANKNVYFIHVKRNENAGIYNLQGSIFFIEDNPIVTSGVVSYSTLRCDVNGINRINFFPRVSNSASSVAYYHDTHTNLTTGYLTQFADSGVKKMQIAWNGQTDIGDIAGGNYAQIESDGEINIISGTPGHYKINGIPISYVMEEWYTDVATSGTGETDLYSFTVPANTLNNNGDKLICSFTAIGDASALGYVEPYFAGTNLASDIVNMINSGIIKIDIEIIRVSTTVARCVITASQGGTYNYITYIELTSKDWTATNILKITGTAAAGAITAKIGYLEYKPVGQ